jgi:predicted permease
MVWARRLWLRLQTLFRRQRVAQRLDDEMQFHLDEQIAENIAAGMSREEARYAALRTFGNPTVLKEEIKDTWGWMWLEQIGQDLRHGARMLRKSPGFTVVAVLTLTLGVGATTAIFSVVDAVLLRPLPYRDPSGLVSLYEDRTRDGFPRKEFTPANYADCKTQQIFEDISAGVEDFFNLSASGGDLERLMGERFTWNIFPLLGVRPLLGRVFREDEDRPGFEHVTLISYRLWHGRFGADPGVIGRDLLLNGQKYSVIGVMPPRFSFPGKNADLWIPVAFTPQQLASRGEHYLTVVARLRPGVRVKQANAELQVLAQRLVGQNPEIMKFVDGFVAEPLRQTYTRDVRRGLIVLLTAVGFILLIACANIANLLLSRATIRQGEIALRSALGAGRGRIVRQLLAESSLLAATGVFFGVLLAVASFSLLKILVPQDLSRTVSLTLKMYFPYW